MLWLAAVLMLETPPSTPNDWLSDARREAALAVTSPRARLAPTTSMIPRSWGNVLFMTPQLRLRAAAIQAREKYMELTPAEIAASWTPTVEILALPDRPAKITSRVVNVEHIVVLTPDGPVQPTAIIDIPRSATNAFGASVSWKGKSATFPLDVLREGNTLHVIVDQVVPIHDEEGLFIDGAPRAKDDSVAISPTILLRLKDLPPQKPTPEGQ